MFRVCPTRRCAKNAGAKYSDICLWLSAKLNSTLPVVALQDEFERQILKPVFHLIGSRLWV